MQTTTTQPKKCMVCNGPYRTPSGFETEMLAAGVDIAVEVTGQELEDLRRKLNNPEFGTHQLERTMDKLVEAAKRQGEQEARVELVRGD